ncbi:dihydroxyacetone kinase subunit DhaL [Sebaldella sp. S0638]|uniref:dihydroxyacetone kinase subunit DhaL n=1 Tax=Sebaldella sp. S0638 TaxID=2957809 RepID=UPI00209CD0A2|nr:dihydroxyacetone kinase subunit DhaL [Sebaldella sp. S0638]MCP1222822.1 dihydroxyacetone kinase subunit DhaL [Sebaldella sp. S0638]
MKNDRVIDVLDEIAKIVVAHEEELTDLDRAIGDGDHGLNLKRGFDAVIAKVDYFRENEDNMDLSKLLNDTAMILLSTVGGASGPLYATALMKMAKAFKDKNEGSVDIDNIEYAVKEAVEGIKQRGNSAVGDKTMVDTLEPFYIAFKKAVQDEKNLKDSFAEGLKAAEKGMLSTKDIQAKRGRASYLGERSIGTIDPGACSSYLILKTIYNQI